MGAQKTLNNPASLPVTRITQKFRDDVPLKIEEGLFLGSTGAANNREALKNLNITHILTVATSSMPVHSSDFVHEIIPVFKKTDINIAQHFDECFDFIEDGRKFGGGVLVR